MAKHYVFVQVNRKSRPELLWISKHVIGILSSFVLLLSIAVSEQVDMDATSVDIPTFTTQEPDSLLIMNLSFAQNLTNPCVFHGSLDANESSMGRENFTKEFFTLLDYYSSTYEEDIESILGNHMMTGCTDLHLGSLPGTPNLAELKELGMEKALNKIYWSLLVHSSYSFVIHYGINSNSTNAGCSDSQEQSLAMESYSMALKLKSVACYVFAGITNLGYEIEDITPLLSLKVLDLTMCSKRSLRNCQIMSSARRFLHQLRSYAVDNSGKSSASLHNSVTSTVTIVPTLITSSRF